MKKGQKAEVFSPKKLQRKGKSGKRKSQKEERRRREKSSGCTLNFQLATLEILAVKYLFCGKRLFGGYVFKNPARYISESIKRDAGQQ